MPSFLLLQSLLKYLHVASEAEVREWQELTGGLSGLIALETQLKEKTVHAFDILKFELAKYKDRSAMRADLLRPCFASISCDAVWERLQSDAPGTQASVLASLSGCAEEDAAVLLRFGCRLSELFAPIELAKRVGRQDWDSRQYSLGAALLPLLDQAIRSLQKNSACDVRVSIFGGCGLTAALASRLGCKVILVEQRRLLRQFLEVLFKHNRLENIQFAETADFASDIVVWDGIDEDGILEFGHWRLLRLHLAQLQKSHRVPLLIPESLRINCALVDDSLLRVRGCRLGRFASWAEWSIEVVAQRLWRG